jgi:hypothetical protein
MVFQSGRIETRFQRYALLGAEFLGLRPSRVHQRRLNGLEQRFFTYRLMQLDFD